MLPIPAEFREVLRSALCRDSGSSRVAVARNALMCRLGLVGLRFEEVGRIQVRDLGGSLLWVRACKHGVQRNVVLDAELSVAVSRWRQAWFPGSQLPDRVFTNGYGRGVDSSSVRPYLVQLTRVICARPYSFHCLRHTAAMECYAATGDVLAVQRLLGHRDLNSTAVYLASLVPGFHLVSGSGRWSGRWRRAGGGVPAARAGAEGNVSPSLDGNVSPSLDGNVSPSLDAPGALGEAAAKSEWLTFW